jgi:hypothetical protein
MLFTQLLEFVPAIAAMFDNRFAQSGPGIVQKSSELFE